MERTVVRTSRAGIGGSLRSFHSCSRASTMSLSRPFLKKYPARRAHVSLRPPSDTPRRASAIQPSPSREEDCACMSSSSRGNGPGAPCSTHP